MPGSPRDEKCHLSALPPPILQREERWRQTKHKQEKEEQDPALLLFLPPCLAKVVKLLPAVAVSSWPAAATTRTWKIRVKRLQSSSIFWKVPSCGPSGLRQRNMTSCQKRAAFLGPTSSAGSVTLGTRGRTVTWSGSSSTKVATLNGQMVEEEAIKWEAAAAALVEKDAPEIEVGVDPEPESNQGGLPHSVQMPIDQHPQKNSRVGGKFWRSTTWSINFSMSKTWMSSSPRPTWAMNR